MTRFTVGLLMLGLGHQPFLDGSGSWANLQAKLSGIPSGDVTGPIRDVQTHLLVGPPRSFLIPDPHATASISGLVPQPLDPAAQSRQEIRRTSIVQTLDQVVPANLMHESETCHLAVTVKRIRPKTLWESLAGWVTPVVTATLAVGVALVFPTSAATIALASAAAIAGEGLWGWLAAHPSFHQQASPLSPAALTGDFVKVVGARQGDRIRAAAAALGTGVELADGTQQADFDRIKGGFVFTNAYQKVPYTFMAVTPLEMLPFEGTRVFTAGQITQVSDPQPVPRYARMPGTIRVGGYRLKDFPRYLDPSGLLAGVQSGSRDERPAGCSETQGIPVSRGVTVSFRATGSPALQVKPRLKRIQMAGLLTEVYTHQALSITRTRLEATLPKPTPYDFPNHILLSSDVLVVHRRQKRLGWPGCTCGHLACLCWMEPYGEIAHHTFAIDVPQRGVYYDSGVDPAGIAAYYYDANDQRLGSQVAPLSAGLPTTTRTQVISNKSVALYHTLWRTRRHFEVVNALEPTALFAQPDRPGSLPPTWGPAQIRIAGPWTYTGQQDIPQPCSAYRARAAVRIIPPPGRGVAMAPRGPLAFSSGGSQGTRPSLALRAIEGLSHAHHAHAR